MITCRTGKKIHIINGHTDMKKTLILITSLLILASCCSNPVGDLKINDLGYFERQEVNVFVYNNLFDGGFNDEKNSGIEIIHHGVRTAQGGAIRLVTTPEQWDLVPATTERTIDTLNNEITVKLRYEDYDFDSRVVVSGQGEAFEIAVYLDEPLPEKLVGRAGFNLEFLPSQYWNKSYIVDGKPERFPRYTVSETTTLPNEKKDKQFKGYRTYDDRGTGRFVEPLPLSKGHEMIFAPEDPERMVKITSDQELGLYDGRILAQNGWYVLRTLLPAGRTGKVVSWTVEPNAVEGWIREPNIGFSQVGYLPDQPKLAVIELDRDDKVQPTAELYKIDHDGKVSKAFKGRTKEWGRFHKYNYVHFDFSQVTEPGVYYIQYGKTKTNNFIIGDKVYDKITEATSDIWIPIHMNHVTVNEGYRIWHGEPFKEGYLQAPANTDHFDLHWQDGSTNTRYKPLELIPGLNVGGYFDAGDFDIETDSNIGVVTSLVNIWERYRPMRDVTFVDEDQRFVDLHRPDGTPDIIQYIEHGTLNLVAQAENIGFMADALSNSVLDNYHHLGDAASITDGLHYDPSLKPYQVSSDGKRSGTPDDMWAFTPRQPHLDMSAANMFALASRALRGYNDDLAKRALKQSERLNREASEMMERMPHNGRNFGRGGNASTSLQLYISTGDKAYLDDFNEQLWPLLERNANFAIGTALDAVPYMDAEYKEKIRPYVEQYKEYVLSLENENPYGVPIGMGNWAGSGAVVNFGATLCLATKHFPEIISSDHAFKAAAYLYGCHPYHNYSLVGTIGATRPKAVFYGNNRADFSFIPGNVAPGLLFRHPDHFENYDDWPFLWGQNEGTIGGNCAYLNFGMALKDMIKK